MQGHGHISDQHSHLTRDKIELMFKNRVFNAAFIFSLTWHIVCMSAVDVVILPGRYKARNLTSVSFLGPILEETALQIMLVNKPVAVTTDYQHALKYTHSISEKRGSPFGGYAEDAAAGKESARAEDKISSALARPFQSAKKAPAAIRRARRPRPPVKASGSISGALAEREVIYKPGKPKLPSWIDASASYMLELELSVSTQGEVNEVVPVVSSGNPEVDLLGIRYIKAWKFVPLAYGSADGQRGRVRLIFAVHEK